MSAQFFSQLKHLAGQYAALQRSYDELAERVLALEEKPGPEVELDLDTLEPIAPKRRGRPPKASA